MHRVDRHEVDLRSFFRPPVAKGALIVLAAAQDGKNVFELRVHLLPVQSEIGFVGQDEAAKGGAGDLLAAAVRKFLQVNIEPMGETQRQRGDGRNELAKFRVHVARRRDIHARFGKAAAAHLRHERGRWTHADGRTQPRFLSAGSGDKRNRARAEFVVHVHARPRCFVRALPRSQRLRGRFHDLHVLRTFDAKLHFRVFAGTLDVVRDGHARLEIVSWRGQDRHARA